MRCFDGLGQLNEIRSRLVWYPEDVWRYVLACQWQRVSREEAFIGRAGEVGDELGSAVVAARLARDVMRLCFLIERKWIPYGKWLGSALARLQIAPALNDELVNVLSAETWKQREESLGRCYEIVATAQNDLGLVEPIEPTTRTYHGRPFVVIHAERFATALQASIGAEILRAAPPVGAIDQFVDSTDVLTYPDRARAIAAAVFGDLR